MLKGMRNIQPIKVVSLLTWDNAFLKGVQKYYFNAELVFYLRGASNHRIDNMPNTYLPNCFHYTMAYSHFTVGNFKDEVSKID